MEKKVEMEEKKEERKKLRINKKVVACVLPVGIAVIGLAGYLADKFQAPDVDDITIEKLLENTEIARDTKLDELNKDDRLMFDKNTTYVEAADKLERAMDNYDDLDNILNDDIKMRSLSNKEQEEIKSYDDFKIKELKATLLSKEDFITKDDKIKAASLLSGIKDIYKKWIDNHGREISLEIMKEAVKAAMLDDFDKDNDQYDVIVFDERYTNSAEPELGSIIAFNKKYQIEDADSEIRDIANYIYILSSGNKIEKGKEFETYRKAIGYAKRIIAQGIDVNGYDLEIKKSGKQVNKVLHK